MSRGDWLLFIGFILIIASLLGIAYYMFTEKVNSCTSDPLKFAVEKIRENYDASKVYGSISLLQGDKKKSWNFGDEQTLEFLNLTLSKN